MSTKIITPNVSLTPVIDLLAQGRSLEEVLNEIIREIESRSPGMLCAITVADGERKRLKFISAPNVPEVYVRAVDGVSIGEGNGPCATAVHRGSMVCIKDIGIDPTCAKLRDVALENGLRACWSIPIRDANGRIFGSFAMYYRKPKLPTPADESLIEAAQQVTLLAMQMWELRERLAKTETKYQMLVEQLPAITYICSVASGEPWTYVSPQVESLLGYAQEEWTGRAGLWESCLHDGDRERVLRQERRGWKEGDRDSQEYRVNSRDGRTLWFHDEATVFRDVSGKLLMQGMMLDITDYKKASEALSRMENQFALVYQASPVPLILSTLEDGRVIEINDAALQLFGRNRKDVIGRNGTDLDLWVNRSDRLKVLEIIQREGKVKDLEGKCWGCGNTIRTVELSAELIELDNKACVMTSLRDVTDRKRTERLNQALFEVLEAADRATSLPDLYRRVHEIIGHVIVADSFYIALLDETGEGLYFPYYKDDEDQPLVHRTRGKGRTEYVLRTGKPLFCDEKKFKDLVQTGDVIAAGLPTAVWAGVPLRVEEKIFGVLAVQHYTDPDAITLEDMIFLESTSSHVAKVIARKSAEAELKLAEERFNQAFQMSPMGMLITVRETGKILEVNDALCNMLEYEPEELLERTTVEVKLHKDEKEREKFLQPFREGRRAKEIQAEFQTKSGKILSSRVSLEKLVLQGEACYLSLIRDVSEQELLEQQLRQAQRMEAVGSLAAGVAHDFNNLLGVILGYSDMLSDRTVPDNVYNRRLQEVRAAVESASGLTRQLLAFSRKQILQPVPLDMNKLIQNLNKMFRRLLGENILIQLEMGMEIGIVKADPGQIEQVLMNLAVNARDAMPQGGQITIQTENVSLDHQFVKNHLGSSPGRFVKLSFSDTGLGMSAEVLNRIFEPFFTTKEIGKGTGLGLSTVYGIVKQSGGSIYVTSEVGVGTTFDIYLPRVEEAVQAVPARPKSALPRGTETVLLVEDEDVLREVTSTLLQMQGYSVLEARNAEDALKVFAREKSTVSLLLTDVVMPGMNGRLLSEKILAERPDLPVLFTSGYTDDEILRHGLSDSRSNILSKPVSRETLANRVREVLDAAKKN